MDPTASKFAPNFFRAIIDGCHPMFAVKVVYNGLVLSGGSFKRFTRGRQSGGEISHGAYRLLFITVRDSATTRAIQTHCDSKSCRTQFPVQYVSLSLIYKRSHTTTTTTNRQINEQYCMKNCHYTLLCK